MKLFKIRAEWTAVAYVVAEDLEAARKNADKIVIDQLDSNHAAGCLVSQVLPNEKVEHPWRMNHCPYDSNGRVTSITLADVWPHDPLCVPYRRASVGEAG